MSKKIDKEIEKWAGTMVKNGFSIHVSTLAPYLYRVYKDEIVNGNRWDTIMAFTSGYQMEYTMKLIVYLMLLRK